MDTIFAVSSGRPPAAIAVLRISGKQALSVGERLAGSLPAPAEARLRTLRSSSGAMLDRALVLCFRAPDTATGENIVELHLHGGVAVVAAVQSELASLSGVRQAEAGEFTRRALLNGRVDLAEAQGLADLLAAETEAQRQSALSSAGGAVSRAVGHWADRLLQMSAEVEAALDLSDEEDVAASGGVARVRADCAELAAEIGRTLSEPTVDRLRDGIRVVLAGPPNSGKSTLFNALAAREAAIVSPLAGTTRDRIEAAVSHGGLPFLLVDTAGLRSSPSDAVEQIGIDRANAAIADADVLLWLGDEPPPAHPQVIAIHARADLAGREQGPADRLAVSARDAESVCGVWNSVMAIAASLIPEEGALALSGVQHEHCSVAHRSCEAAAPEPDLILLAEHLRHARSALDAITGRTHTEDVLDALFARFCVGK